MIGMGWDGDGDGDVDGDGDGHGDGVTILLTTNMYLHSFRRKSLNLAVLEILVIRLP